MRTTKKLCVSITFTNNSLWRLWTLIQPQFELYVLEARQPCLVSPGFFLTSKFHAGNGTRRADETMEDAQRVGIERSVRYLAEFRETGDICRRDTDETVEF
jgi:hypothetical protein